MVIYLLSYQSVKRGLVLMGDRCTAPAVAEQSQGPIQFRHTSPGYRRMLEIQGVPQVLASSVLARLPNGMTTVLIVLLVNRSSGSFALAGLVVAANSLGFAAASPLLGKLSDRGYTVHVLTVVGALSPLATTLFIISVSTRWPPACSVALAAIAGVIFPPISAITRAGWNRMLPGHLHRVAYGAEALITEMLYIVGPLLASLALMVSGPATGLIVGAVCVAIGSILLALSPGIRGLRTARVAATDRGRSMWTIGSAAVIVVGMGMGTAFGVLEVCIPAFASSFANGEVVGAMLLAVWSVASVAGGLIYLRLNVRRSMQSQLLILVLGNAIGFALLGLASTPLVLGALLLLGGLLLAPAATAELSVMGLVATPGRTTETFTWMNTSSYVGGAGGSAVAGVLIEGVGINVTMSLSAAFALVAVAGAVVSVRAGKHKPVGAEEN